MEIEETKNPTATATNLAELEELIYGVQSDAIKNLAIELDDVTNQLYDASTNTSKYEGLIYELKELAKLQTTLMANRNSLHVKNNYDLPGGPCGLEEC